MFFNSGISSIADSAVLASGIPFGKIRLWGSIGYAIGVQISGLISQKLGIKSILGVYIIFMILAMLIMETIRFKNSDVHKIKISDFNNLLKNKRYALLSLGCFLVGGSIIGNNNLLEVTLWN